MCESKCNKKKIYLKFVKPQFSKSDNLSKKSYSNVISTHFYAYLY